MPNYSAIPLELRAIPQWIVWRMEDVGASKPSKVPFNARTGNLSSVTDPSTWSTFEECLSVVENYSGLGFVFTETDVYSFIDLDNTNGDQNALNIQLKIFNEFDSYSEISPSGKGLHIIVKGKVKVGRRRSFIEIYSSQRYATMTGNVYHDKPINDQQEKLSQLWEQMGGGTPKTNLYHGDSIEKLKDADVIAQALKALNGDKFKILNEGRWQELYQSQSEADFAYIDILAFYTQNKSQIMRLFRSSALGKRDKAKRNDYLSWMIERSFDRMLPQLDFDGFKIALDNKLNEQQLELKIGTTAVSSNGKTASFDGANLGSSPSAASIPQLPPGLLGELAQFIYAAAPRPVPEIALAGAIGLMAGITGRAYNVSGTGLNQYVLLLAMTGVGKEALASGIDKLMNAIRFQVPTSISFIGPSEIASGQALIKYLYSKSQSFVCVLGEFGLRLQQMSNQNANGAEVSLRRMLLDLFNKSGHGQIMRPSIYSDKDKNTDLINSPAFSILGESTPERFYGALNEEMISEGLLPRFTLIEYNGLRTPLNPGHQKATPSFSLIEKLATLAAQAETINHANPRRVINIISSSEAEKILYDFDKYADLQINGTTKDVIRQLWNRAHIKVLKLSGLVAVGCNLADPIIQAEHVQWSIDMIQNDIRRLSEKFDAGEIGMATSESKQTSEIIRVIREYVTRPWDYICKYVDTKRLFDDKVIPYAYISRRLMALGCFRADKAGATNSIKRAIQVLIDSDKLREISKSDLATKYGTTQRSFIISNINILN